jgi:hypothetical protein
MNKPHNEDPQIFDTTHTKCCCPGDLATGICAVLHRPTECRQRQCNIHHYLQIIKLTVWTDLLHTAVGIQKDWRHGNLPAIFQTKTSYSDLLPSLAA